MYALIQKAEAWVHRQHPIVSSLTHAGICVGLVLFGWLLDLISGAVDPTLTTHFMLFFYAFGLGAYSLRELESGRVELERGESKKLLGTVEDLYAPLLASTLVFVLLGGSLA